MLQSAAQTKERLPGEPKHEFSRYECPKISIPPKSSPDFHIRHSKSTVSQNYQHISKQFIVNVPVILGRTRDEREVMWSFSELVNASNDSELDNLLE